MKKLNAIECQTVSGGGQYLLVTSRYTVEGYPEECIFNFYQTYKDHPFTVNEDNIFELIGKGCPGWKGGSSSIESEPIKILVINE